MRNNACRSFLGSMSALGCILALHPSIRISISEASCKLNLNVGMLNGLSLYAVARVECA